MEPSELTGQTLEGYRLDRIIGQGGMGAVYQATHLKLGRKVAIKLLSGELAGSKEYVSRFLHEARVVNDVRHPNIVDITDFIELEAPRRIAYVMELLNGPSLKQLVRQRPLDPTQTANVMIQIVSALEAVHGIGVVHRDLKPDNILVVGEPASDLSAVPSVKVLDFGIAKVSQAEGHRTATGLLMGTPAYMAPEQIAAEPVTAASDVFALGEILYECLTGRKLFEGQPVMILKQKLKGEMPVIDLAVDPGVKSLLEPLIHRTLQTDASLRPSLGDIALVMTDILRLYSSAALRVPAASVPATYDPASLTPSGAGSWPSPSHPAGSLSHPAAAVQASEPGAALLQGPEGGVSTETSAGMSMLAEARSPPSRMPIVVGALALVAALAGAAWFARTTPAPVVEVLPTLPAEAEAEAEAEDAQPDRNTGTGDPDRAERTAPIEGDADGPESTEASIEANTQKTESEPSRTSEATEPSRTSQATEPSDRDRTSRRRNPRRRPAPQPEPTRVAEPTPTAPRPAEAAETVPRPAELAPGQAAWPQKPSTETRPKKKLIKKDEIKGW